MDMKKLIAHLIAPPKIFSVCCIMSKVDGVEHIMTLYWTAPDRKGMCGTQLDAFN
jgi:hypothetical protein